MTENNRHVTVDVTLNDLNETEKDVYNLIKDNPKITRDEMALKINKNYQNDSKNYKFIGFEGIYIANWQQQIWLLGGIKMIIDSFDIKTEPVMSIKDFYGEKKNIIEICLVIFSKETYNYILKKYDCEVIGVIKACNGEYPIYKFNFEGKILGFYLTMIGSTMASQFVIEANWITGASKFIMFGSSGSLNKEITFNKYVIPTEAYRDEGMSYHYAPASDYIMIKNHSIVKKFFDELHLPNVEGKIWTTDAFLRETKGQMSKRKEEGCIAVEMEIAGVQSVCDFHNLDLYSFIVTGDILSEEKYEVEGLHNANHSLDKLFIALEIAKRL